ncbi:MAG TPA: hypothetical protein VHH57_09475 [Gaiella sp.]|nr:hypothetical protein [Gaiella sp.]
MSASTAAWDGGIGGQGGVGVLGAFEDVADGSDISCQHELDAVAFEVAGKLLEHGDRGDVDVGHGLAVEDDGVRSGAEEIGSLKPEPENDLIAYGGATFDQRSHDWEALP